MLTEEKAKEKMCCGPMAKHISQRGSCIASACMAWRFMPQMWRHTGSAGTWDDPYETSGYGRKGEKLPHVGYCGLAGAAIVAKGGA